MGEQCSGLYGKKNIYSKQLECYNLKTLELVKGMNLVLG